MLRLPFLGPLVYIAVASQGILVFNKHYVATDLLDRRGHIYSDRPRMICEYGFCRRHFVSQILIAVRLSVMNEILCSGLMMVSPNLCVRSSFSLICLTTQLIASTVGGERAALV